MTPLQDVHTSPIPRAGSDRSFGFVFAVVFFAIGAWPALHDGELRHWALAIGATFLTLALVRPSLLASLNRAWHRLGLAMGLVTTPLVMGALFLFVVTPTGIAMRLLKKNTVRLRFDTQASSYWLERNSPPPTSDSLKHPF